MEIPEEQSILLAESFLALPPEGMPWLLKRNNLPNVRSIHQIRLRAEEFGVSMNAALIMRERFLRSELAMWDLYEEELVDPLGPIFYGDRQQIEKELGALEEARTPITVRDDTVTPEMVERARSVPVDTLIEFKHGKAHCPFHDDKVPSMFYGTRANRAVCPSGCNDSWDSIAIVQRMDGLSFHDAVRKLCGG